MSETLVIVDRVISDEGSVVIFEGAEVTFEVDAPEPTGSRIQFAVDHRMAQNLIEGIEYDVEPTVSLEGWQILHRWSPSEVDA
jgi:hypothetical protein